MARGWAVYVMFDSANNTPDSTAPGAKYGHVATTWAAASAMGFYANQSGGAVTVGTWQRESALIQATDNAIVNSYVTNIRYNTGDVDTGFAISTPSASIERYINRALSTDYATPKPSYAPRFEFGTTSTVEFTQASAWAGYVDGNSDVIGDSSDMGFKVAIAEFATSGSWSRDAKSILKMDLTTSTNSRQSANYNGDTAAGWWIAISANPNSAGAKTHGAVAIDITYS